jgi:hypothetical protein
MRESGNFLSHVGSQRGGRRMWIKIIRVQHHAHMKALFAFTWVHASTIANFILNSHSVAKEQQIQMLENPRVCSAERLACSIVISRKNLSVNYEFFSGGNR